jgi:hypothetical protein
MSGHNKHKIAVIRRMRHLRDRMAKYERGASAFAYDKQELEALRWLCECADLALPEDLQPRREIRTLRKGPVV